MGNRRVSGVVSSSRTSFEGERLGEDSALVERATGGDVDAYEALVRRYQEVAFRTAYLVLGSDAEADDVAQDAFVKAYYALGRFRAGAPFRPWLLRIVANEARNRRKAGGRRTALALRAHQGRPAEMAPSPEHAFLAGEQRTALLRAVDELRDEDRQVVAYRYFLELSEAEMAEALGCARDGEVTAVARAREAPRGPGRSRERGNVAGAGRRWLSDGGLRPRSSLTRHSSGSAATSNSRRRRLSPAR